jgi:hypothetical protein
MLNCFLIAAVLLLFQKPVETGIIAGTVALPAGEHATRPAQVLLLTPEYTNLWNSDLQKRLDSYWERYKPAFAQNKEFFREVSLMAQRESFNYIAARVRRDSPEVVSRYVRETSADGKFEFKNVPFGQYEVLALGTADNKDFVFQDTVELRTAIPQFIELKQHLP